MKGLTTRIKAIEARLRATADDNGNAYDELARLCRHALDAIEAGHIVDQPPERTAWQLSPTIAHTADMDESLRSHIWGILQHMGELVGRFALATGWRSPSHPGDGWRAYRANSAAEMAFVAEAILAWLSVDD